MSYTDRDRTIALAGIFQAARLVQQIANTGMVEQDNVETCVKSLFKIDSSTPEDVFEGGHKLTLGYKTLLEQLGGASQKDSNNKPRDIDITKYAISIAVLERRLSKNNDMSNKIAEEIEAASQQLDHYGYTHDNILAKLAHVYSETISTLKPRIIVNGEHQHISNPNQANKIRAILLAGVRAAVLWRQCGGSRWQLLFTRKKVVGEAEKLLRETQLH